MMLTGSRRTIICSLVALAVASARPQSSASPQATADGDGTSSGARQVRRIAGPSSSRTVLNVLPAATTTAAPPTVRKRLVTLAPTGDSIQAILFNNGYRKTPADAEPAINNIDDKNNLEGLDPHSVWLLDGNLLVLKGGLLGDDEFDDADPLDDFQAPYREPKFPPRGLFDFNGLPPGVFGQGFSPRGFLGGGPGRGGGGRPEPPSAYIPPQLTDQLGPRPRYVPHGPYVPYAPYARVYNRQPGGNAQPPVQHQYIPPPPEVQLPLHMRVLEQPNSGQVTINLPERDPTAFKKGASITSRPESEDPTTRKQGFSITSRPHAPILSRPEAQIPNQPQVIAPTPPKQTFSVRKSFSTTSSTSSTSMSALGQHYLPPPRRARARTAPPHQ